MEYNWTPVSGRFTISPDEIRFHGEPVKYGEEMGAAVGTAISNQKFSGGSISAEITFTAVSEKSACDLLFYRDPATQAFVGGGLGGEAFYGVRQFYNQWTVYASGGDLTNLEAGRAYRVKVRLRGSKIRLFVDEVEVTSTTLPYTIPQSQVGVFCRDISDILISNYAVESEIPRAFIVMQFSSPYNELYEEVIKPICEAYGVEARRADETYGPGLIIADVIGQIDESKLVIAEITPANPNVYYELG